MTLQIIQDIKSDVKYNQFNSYTWFRNKVKQLFNGDRIPQMHLLSSMQENLTTQLLPGSMYLFGYYPKYHEKLPFYDKFPLVIPFRKDAKHFYGLNFHYLPYQYRLILLNKLMQFAQHNKEGEIAMLKFSWNLISNMGKFPEVQPAVKCYLHGHVMTRFIQIPPEDWTIITMLPTSNFAKKKDTFVWKQSKQKIIGMR